MIKLTNEFENKSYSFLLFYDTNTISIDGGPGINILVPLQETKLSHRFVDMAVKERSTGTGKQKITVKILNIPTPQKLL